MAGATRARSSVKETALSRVAPGRRPRLDVSADGSCSSEDSACTRTAAKKGNLRHKSKDNGVKSVKVAPDGAHVSLIPLPIELPSPVLEPRRCPWITAYSEPQYVSFHDEEWGVPVHDDRKLFELLVLSVALAELSWPAILSNRDMFRKFFEYFEPSSVAEFTEKEILTFRNSRTPLLSEQRLRAVVENARQILKITKEFGSFSHYCWSFVNQKPMVNGFQYSRQVPVKTPKAETMSKNMIRRGFRCVGPTVVYSFMQVAGLVNDHLCSCFRFQACIPPHAPEPKRDPETHDRKPDVLLQS